MQTIEATLTLFGVLVPCTHYMLLMAWSLSLLFCL